MSNDITYMDCWHYVAPLLPVNTDFGEEVYVMIFNALKEAEKKRRVGMTRKRFIKLLMADYISWVVAAAESSGKQFAGGGKTGGKNDADQH